MFKVKYTKAALNHIPKLKSANLNQKAQKLIKLLQNNPFQNPPSYEKLKNNLKTAYSRRINIKHRLVYQVFEKEKTIKILSMWTHYDF